MYVCYVNFCGMHNILMNLLDNKILDPLFNSAVTSEVHWMIVMNASCSHIDLKKLVQGHNSPFF